IVALISLYSNSSYRPGVYGTLIYFLVGIAYFAIAGRHRLVLSPEEEFALTRGQHGDPAAEGYGTTHVADIPAGESVAEEAPAPGQASSGGPPRPGGRVYRPGWPLVSIRPPQGPHPDMPPSVNRSKARHCKRSPALSEYFEFGGRDHWTCAAPGWEAV